MFNFFKKNKGNKEQALQTNVLQKLAEKERILKTFERKGLISYNPATKRLFIAKELAQIFLNDKEKWTSFLHSVHQWALYHRQEEAWKKYFQDIETKAVREARKKYAVLSKSDIQRIRQKARQEVDISAVKAPQVEPFEFFIADIESTTADKDILAVGNFNGTDFEIESYENIQRFLRKE